MVLVSKPARLSARCECSCVCVCACVCVCLCMQRLHIERTGLPKIAVGKELCLGDDVEVKCVSWVMASAILVNQGLCPVTYPVTNRTSGG